MSLECVNKCNFFKADNNRDQRGGNIRKLESYHAQWRIHSKNELEYVNT